MADRSIVKVIDTMLEQMPPGTPIEHDFKSLRDSCSYTAPELMRDRWLQGSQLLAEHFGKDGPQVGWEQRIVDIWTGR